MDTAATDTTTTALTAFAVCAVATMAATTAPESLPKQLSIFDVACPLCLHASVVPWTFLTSSLVRRSFLSRFRVGTAIVVSEGACNRDCCPNASARHHGSDVEIATSDEFVM